ncbi:MAG TPA: DUF2723 domain-containing protein [Kofleriaceae bacterium]|nr:DUF2723 domain-containing protein [Kofleriaceae bacterium]
MYAALASPCIVAADNAEFASLGALGGAAHPSGYPLYVLWLRAWSWLPAQSPAHAAALATAILGGLAIGVLHAACRAWGARPVAATIAVAIVGAAPIVLQYATEAEVFAINGLIAALVVWLSAAGGPLRGRWRGAALGLVAGLGLSAHLTCALVAPIGLYGVVRAARESRPTTYALAAAGFALGLVPYAYLFVADGPASWGTISSLGELWATIQRREYGGLELVPGGADVPWTASVGALAATAGRSWLWLPGLAGVAMLAVRIWRPVGPVGPMGPVGPVGPVGETRAAWLLLAASIALAGPILVSRFNIDPHGMGLTICRRFYILPILLMAVPVAAALDVACARLTRPHLAGALAIAGFGALVVADLPGLARVHSPAMERGVANLFRSLPPAAVAVVISEDLCFGGHYLQLARGVRPDVAFVCSELLRRDWYRARWAGRGLALPIDPGAPLGEALLRTGRPIFVDRGLTRLLATYPSYPLGILYRALPRGTPPPAAHAIAAENRDVYQRFDLDYPRPGRDDDFAAVAHRRYTANWAAVANLLDAAGDREAAHDAVELARQLQPERD